MIYKRDYTQLSVDENQKLTKANKFSESKKGIFSITALNKFHKMMPPAGYHFESLFPNNYLIFNYEKHIDCYLLLNGFSKIIQNTDSNERDILNYIRDNEAYFILESLFYYFDFGHHDSYLFREFPLPPQYNCDFLLVGKNSGGYEFVFIEFEHPNQNIVLKDGDLGIAFRKGLKQVEDWELWIESSFHSLKNVFNIYRNKSMELPSEFYEFDKSRVHFLVVAGKREHFKEKTYRLKRKNRNSVKIIHYDNVIDVCECYLQEHKRAIEGKF